MGSCVWTLAQKELGERCIWPEKLGKVEGKGRSGRAGAQTKSRTQASLLRPPLGLLAMHAWPKARPRRCSNLPPTPMVDSGPWGPSCSSECQPSSPGPE